MKATKLLHDALGAQGSYVLLKLQLEAAGRKDGRVPISRNIHRYAKDWRPAHAPVVNGIGLSDEALIRRVVSFCKDKGVATLIHAKSETFLKFADDYVLNPEKCAVRHSMKLREATIDKAKPSDSNEVFLYFKELGLSESLARTESYTFWDYWVERAWRRKSGAIKDWKATARRWVRSINAKQAWL
jgi:hypothetical protein